MQIRSWIWAVLVIAACGSRQQTAPPAPTTPPPAQQTAGGASGGGTCPMMIDPATTQITTSDTNDGVAIVFTTSGDVSDLRTRVRRMADMHNLMAGMHGKAMGEGMQGGGMQGGGMQGGGMQGGGMQGGGMQGGGMQGRGMMHMQMVPSRATVEEIPGGARLVLVPTDPAQVAALREHVRMHAGMMQKGQCPMMAQPSPAPGPGHEQHHPGGT